MKVRRAALISGAALLFLIVCWQGILLFRLETDAILWRVRHGSTLEFNRIKFHVPLFYKAGPLENGMIYITTDPGYYRWKRGRPLSGTIRIAPFSKPDPTIDAQKFPPGTPLPTLIKKETATLAGRQGLCAQYEDPLDPTNKNPSSPGEKIFISISCSFAPDVDLNFYGGTTAARDFHRFIQSAEAIKGNN